LGILLAVESRITAVIKFRPQHCRLNNLWFQG
jgi:hypothetical protein